MARAAVAVEADPGVAAAMLEDADFRAAARESRYLRDFADRTAGWAAFHLGDLRRCLDVSHRLCASPSLLMAESAVRLLGAAAVLACDDGAVDAAAVVADERLSKVSGTQAAADLAIHQRSLLAGGSSRLEPAIRAADIDLRDLKAFNMMLMGREAVDAGDASLAVEAVRRWPSEAPVAQAVRVAIEATATQDENRWHEASSLAVEHGLRLIAVDALEGLAGAASAAESWAECLRLEAAAARLRDETGYRWRFACEQDRLETALAAAAEALGPEGAGAATAEGAELDWHEAVTDAGRARGERKRPSHGWSALTPTELRIVALVADGLTNPQIGGRLLMGRATVKTHLDHVFTKTGLHSRTEVAAEYVRRHRDAPTPDA
jgi:DNA-binding CsgD family transcriptional regulator